MGSDSEHIGTLIALYSYQLISECAFEPEETVSQNRVALFDVYKLRAYFSHSNCKNCIYDCRSNYIYPPVVEDTSKIRGPCAPVDITQIAKEMFTYEPETGRKLAV